jgi:hypothetical protein
MIDDRRAVKPHDPKKKTSVNPRALTEQALAFWAAPTLSPVTRAALLAYARSAAVDAAKEPWQRDQYPALALGALRALVVASPDYQTS